VFKVHYAATLHWALKYPTEFRFIKQFDASPSGHSFSINHYLIAKQFSKPKQDQVINDSVNQLWDMITLTTNSI
jgi:hypothetical protein